jgi:hypothetical protein
MVEAKGRGENRPSEDADLDGVDCETQIGQKEVMGDRRQWVGISDRLWL